MRWWRRWRWWKGKKGLGDKVTEKEQLSGFNDGLCMWVRATAISMTLVSPLIICVALDKSILIQEKAWWAINYPWGFMCFFVISLNFFFATSLDPHKTPTLSIHAPFHWCETDGEFMKCEVILLEMRKLKWSLVTTEHSIFRHLMLYFII